MSGDDDPEHGSLGDLLSNPNLANLKNQPVTGQTFAQKQGPFIELFCLLFGQVFLGTSVYFGLLFAGRGKTLPVWLKRWGVQADPRVKVTVDLYQVFFSFVYAGLLTCVTAGVVINLPRGVAS